MNVENTKAQMRKGVLEYCILSILSQGEAYPSEIIAELKAQKQEASVVSMICDGGERYLDTYYNCDWLTENGFDTTPYRQQLDKFYETGTWQSPD